jgi:hypothetical protein
MAQTIPTVLEARPGDTGWQAEKIVFDNLKSGLPDSTLVVHSQEFLSRNKNSKLCEGEADFIIVDPDQGLVILEVKSGSLRREPDGIWYHNNGKARSPFEQARKQKYQLKNELVKILHKDQLLFDLGYAVALPDSDPIKKIPTLDGDPCIVITGRELPHINHALSEIYKSFQKNKLNSKAKEVLGEVKDLFLRQIHYGVSLSQLIKNEEHLQGHLTEKQYHILTMLRKHNEVKIVGGPGTGKSFLALHKARELCKQGFKVLLLCFNRPLGRFFEKECEDLGESCFAQTFHTFAWKTVKAHTNYELDFEEVKNDNRFWKEELPFMLVEALESTRTRFDALIVDEAQDFHKNYWDAVLSATTNDHKFYVFYDPTQDIWNHEQDIPVHTLPIELDLCCRNTQNICSYIEKKTQHRITPMKELPLGEVVREENCISPEDVQIKLKEILDSLLKRERVCIDDVVILGGHSMKNSSLGPDPSLKIGKWGIESDLQKEGELIRYHTYMRFKGCESPVVILIDYDPADKRWDSRGSLIAMSRARSLLYVLQKCW